jgi:hypothetical protein
MVFHASTKNIECHYHFVYEKILLRKVELVHVPTSDRLINIFTKVVGKNMFEEMKFKLGIVSTIN